MAQILRIVKSMFYHIVLVIAFLYAIAIYEPTSVCGISLGSEYIVSCIRWQVALELDLVQAVTEVLLRCYSKYPIGAFN